MVDYIIECGLYEVKVSAEDFEWLCQWRWNWKKSDGRHRRNIYARRGGGANRYGGIYPTIYMHIEVCIRAHGPRPEGMTPHHINHDTLDNRRENLRWATTSEQSKLQRKRRYAYGN